MRLEWKRGSSQSQNSRPVSELPAQSRYLPALTVFTPAGSVTAPSAMFHGKNTGRFDAVKSLMQIDLTIKHILKD
jgi:hypothetical protein